MLIDEDFFALWLKPSSVYYDYLGKIILDLSHRFQSPVFEPHLTLFFGSMPHLHELQVIFDQQLNNFSPIILEVDGVKATEHLFKTFFIVFKENQFLNKLSAFINRSFASVVNYPFSPHVSLLYADIPLREKMHLSKQIKIELSDIQFDQLQLVKIPNLHHVGNLSVVKTWKFKSLVHEIG